MVAYKIHYNIQKGDIKEDFVLDSAKAIVS